MVEYRQYGVGSFTDVAGQWGDALWSFLNEAQHVRLMIEVSEGGRPAAEGIADALYRRFGDPVRQDRVKQFMGALIRQVMERHGYVLEVSGVTLRPNPVFTQASRYVRR